MSNDKFREYLPSKLPMKNTSPFEQGSPYRVSWWGEGGILTKITKNCLKMAKAVFFDICSTNTIALPITTPKLFFLFQKTWRGYFLNLKGKDIWDNNSGALWNCYHLARKNPLRNFVSWANKVISEDEKHFEQIFL